MLKAFLLICKLCSHYWKCNRTLEKWGGKEKNTLLQQRLSHYLTSLKWRERSRIILSCLSPNIFVKCYVTWPFLWSLKKVWHLEFFILKHLNGKYTFLQYSLFPRCSCFVYSWLNRIVAQQPFFFFFFFFLSLWSVVLVHSVVCNAKAHVQKPFCNLGHDFNLM